MLQEVRARLYLQKCNLTSSCVADQEDSRRRLAALSLPSLLNRCRNTLVGYVADETLRGNLPFPRSVPNLPHLNNNFLTVYFQSQRRGITVRVEEDSRTPPLAWVIICSIIR